MKNKNSNFISSSFGLSWLRASLNVAAFACASLLVITSLADAGGAQGARVRRGNVSFSQDGNRLVVRASNGAIIEYDRLSVEAGQIMQFIQPSATSRVLNRVTGSELTRIDGTLLSNGIVYLINPQGFRIGNGAVIKVGGFFAAAGAMSNSDFVAGRDRFTNLTGQVTNEGLIQAQAVALVGQYVASRGTIDVGNGYLAMGAGDSVVIQKGTGPVMVTVSRSQLGADGSGAGTQAAISNTGTINAGKGSVSMASGDFYALAMDLSGTIIGKSIAARGGKDGVVAVNGTLDASSSTGKGGTIDVFGDRIGLFGDALVNANGATGGGSVRIGGDYLGTNAANAPQASRTFIGDNARITANATQSGNGGRVIVWSNEYTGFFGSIEASAGGTGKGGFIETSSKDNLQAFGSVDASSALGQAGTWLLDPADLTISSAVNTAGGTGTAVDPFAPLANSSVLNTTTLRDALQLGDVTIQTDILVGTVAETGTITFADWLTPTLIGATTLTVNSVGDIVVNSGVIINATGAALNLAFNADGTGGGASTGAVTLTGSVNTNGGSLTVVAAGAVTQGGASTLVIGGTTSVTTGNAAITLTQAANDFGGAVSLTNTSTNDVAISDTNILDLGASSIGQNLSIVAANLAITGAISAAGSVSITSTSGTSVTLGDSIGGLNLTNIELGFLTAGTDLNITAAGAGTMTVNRVATGGAITGITTLTAGGSGVTFSSFDSTFNNALTVASPAVIASVNLTSGGAMAFSNTLELRNSSVTLTAGPGGTSGIDFNGAINGGDQNLTVTASTVNFVGALTNMGSGTGAAITLNTTGLVDFQSTVGGASGIVSSNLLSATKFQGDVTLGNGNTASSFAGGVTFDGMTWSGFDGLTVSGDTTLSNGPVSLSTNGGDLTFIGSVNGNVDLTLTAGAGVINFQDVGSSVALSSLTIASAGDVNIASGVTTTGLVSITSDTNTAITLGGVPVGGFFLDAGEVNSITAGSLNIEANGLGMTVIGMTGAGNITGITTLTAGGSGVTFTGSSSTFNNALTVASAAILSADVSTADAAMNFGVITMGVSATLSSGSGVINVASLVGGVNVLTLGSLAQTGTVTFAGDAAAQGLTTFGSAYSIAFNGTTNSFIDDTTFLNTGSVTLGNGAGDTSTFTGGLDTTAASGTNIAGIVETTNTQMDLGATTMGAASTLRSGSGVINVASLAGGANILTLGSATQTGTVTFAGDAVAQGLTTFGSAYSIAFNGTTNTFTNDTTFLNTGSVTLGNDAGDTSTFTGGLDTTAALLGTNIAGIVETTNTQMDLGATTLSNAATLRSGTGAINVASLVGNANVLSLGSATQTGTVTFAGSVTGNSLTTFASGYAITMTGATNTFSNRVNFLNTGLVTLGSAAGTETFAFNGGLLFNGNAPVSVGAIISSSGDARGDIDFGSGGLTLVGNTSVTVLNFNITFGSAVAVTADDAQSLTVNAGTTGIITFGGDVGAPLLRLSALDVTGTAFYGGEVYVAGSANYGNVVLTGNRTFTTVDTATFGTVDGNGFTMNIVAGDLALTAAVTNIGILTIENIAPAGSITLMSTGGLAIETQAEWNFIQPSVTSVVLGNTIDYVGAITVAAAWTNNSAVTMNFLLGGAGEFNVDGVVTGTGTLNVNGSGNTTTLSANMTQAGISILDAIDVGGANIVLTATVGNVTLNSSGFAAGISSSLFENNLSLRTTAAGGLITVIGDFTSNAGDFVNNVSVAGTLTNPTNALIAASGEITGTLSVDRATSLSLSTDSGSIAPNVFTAAAVNVGTGIATTLTTDSTLVTTGSIIFGGTLDGSAGGETITLTAGAGNIIFTGAVGAGGGGPLGAMLINSAQNVTASSSITAASFVQSVGSGTTTFAGVQSYSAAAGLNVTNQAIALNNGVDTAVAAVGGIVTLNATLGSLAINALGDISSDGAVNLTGVGGISTGGDVLTSVDVVNFNSATTLTNAVLVSTTGGDINFVAALTGPQALTLQSFAGNITFSGAVGAVALTSILINDANNVTAAAINAGSFTQLVGTGTTNLNGLVTLTGALDLNGVIFNIAGGVNAGGLVSITNSGVLTTTSAIVAGGGFTQDGGGANSLGGNITTTDDAILFTTDVTLTSGVLLNTVSVGGGNNITVGARLSGTVAGAQTLGLTAGSGNIVFGSLVGGGATGRLGAITITSANDVTAAGITAASFQQIAGTGTTNFNGPQNYNAIAGLNVVTGGTVVLNNTVTTTNSGTVTLTGTTAVTIAAAGDITSDGAVNFTSTGGVSTAGDVTTTNDAVIYNSATTLTGNVLVNTGAGIGNINFFNTLNGTFDLGLTAGTGDIAFTGIVGATLLGAVTINAANSVTMLAAFTAQSLNQAVAGTGTFQTNGVLTATTGGVTINSALVDINANIVASGAGQNILVTGTTDLGGNVTTNDGNVTFASATTLSGGARTITTGAGAGNILFSSTLDGGSSLALTAGTGDITFTGIVGAVALGDVTINVAANVTMVAFTAASLNQAVAGTGTFQNNGVLTATTGGVTINSSLVDINANIVASGTLQAVLVTGTTDLGGNVTTNNGNVTFASATTLSGAARTITTGAGAGNILFSSTLDGAFALALTAGTGDITFTGAVGATPLGAITIASARNVNALDSITADSFVQSSGSGTTTFGGAQIYSQVAGLNVTNQSITLNNSVDTIAGGNVGIVTLNATSGLLTINSAGDITSDGVVNLTGVGGISTAGDVTTTGEVVNYNSATTLSGPVVVDTTNAGTFAGDDINFLSTLNGVQALTLTADLGDITFTGIVGATPLGAVTINSANNVTMLAAFTAQSLNQAVAGTGTFQNNGVLTATTGGVTINSLNVDINANIVSGGLNAAVLVTGTTDLGGNVATSNGDVTFASATTLSGAARTISTGAGAGNILFSSTLDGGQNLTLTAGTGDVFFDAAVGSIAPLASLTVVSADLTTHFAGNVTTVGDQLFNGGASIDSDVTFTATDTLANITFNGAINSAALSNFDMTVIAGGNVIFNGNIGSAVNGQLGTFTVDSGNDLGETITFGDGSFDTTASFEVSAQSVQLNTGATSTLAAPATIATIASQSDVGITFNTDDFAMGQNHKLTSYGAIEISGLTGTSATSVTLGDVNAVGDFTVDSGSINLLARSGGQILTNTGGTTNDPMVDVVVGGRVYFSTAPVMIGSGKTAAFSNPTGNVDGSGTLGNYAKTVYPSAITRSLLTGLAGEVLDLSARSGKFSLTNPATFIPPPMPILPAIGILGNSDTLDEAKDKEKAKAVEEAGTKKTASESNPAPTGIPVASR